MSKTLSTILVAVLLAGSALVAVGGTLSGPPHWTPDGLFYQTRALELGGADREQALAETFGGPMGADLRRVDPERSGDPAWVAYNAQFYERRITVPLAASVLDGVSGERAVLDLSLAGYVVTILALFVLLLLRFRLVVAALATLATVFLPALVHHSSFPLTDSWGIALLTIALISGMLALERGPRWLIAWTAAVVALAFTRDLTYVLILASGWLALTLRSKVSFVMLGTALAATVPVLILFPAPMRDLLAQMLNDAQPIADPTWGYIIERYPGAIVDLLRANGGFVRDGAWYSAAYLAVGLIALFTLTRGTRSTPSMTLMKGAALAGTFYVLAVPVFSGFRLELVWVPMAAYGLALLAERALGTATSPRLLEKPRLVPSPPRA